MSVESILGREELANTEWSVVVRPPSGHVWEHGATRLLKTASVAKLFLLIEVATRLEQGDFDARTPLSRTRVAPVGDSGLWQYLSTDTLPLDDVASLVGAASDNLATNVLVDLVGLDAVAEQSARLAPAGSKLLDIVRDARTAEHPSTLSLGCASDWASIMHELHVGDVLGRGVCSKVLEWLGRALDLSMVAASLGLDPLSHAAPDRGFLVWSKTGTDGGVRADVGHVKGPRGALSYAAICNWAPDAGDPRDEVLDAMRDIGALIRAEAS